MSPFRESLRGLGRHWGWGSWLGLASLVAAAAEPAAVPDLPPSFSIRPEMYATGFEFADGPAFDDHGNLYVANYRGQGRIGRIAASGQAGIWCDLAQVAPVEGRAPQPRGMKVDAEGSVVVADFGGGRLLRISPDGKQVDVLAERFEGTRFLAPNDLTLGSKAHFFTDSGDPSDPRPIGSVYRYDVNTRQVSRVATGLSYPSGIAMSPDQRFLCVAESRRFRVLLFDLDAQGMPTGQRVLTEFPERDAGGLRGGPFEPDGLIFDEFGRLYVAMWNGGIVNVVDVPSGRVLRQYEAGGTQASNLHFFGQSLYVSVVSHEAVYRLRLGVRGWNYRPQ